jgi:hypothetical protein
VAVVVGGAWGWRRPPHVVVGRRRKVRGPVGITGVGRRRIMGMDVRPAFGGKGRRVAWWGHGHHGRWGLFGRGSGGSFRRRVRLVGGGVSCFGVGGSGRAGRSLEVTSGSCAFRAAVGGFRRLGIGSLGRGASRGSSGSLRWIAGIARWRSTSASVAPVVILHAWHEQGGKT